MKSIVNLALRLTLICAIAALALANVAEVTRGPIAESEARAQREAVEAVLPAFARLAVDTLKSAADNPVLYFSGLQESGPSGTAFKASSGLGYSGEIEIILGVKPDGEISGVRILKHAETPGLGANYADPELLNKFYKGRRMDDNWKLAKDGGQVDAITGATVTGRAIADAIESGLQDFQKNRKHIRAVAEPATNQGHQP